MRSLSDEEARVPIRSTWSRALIRSGPTSSAHHARRRLGRCRRAARPEPRGRGASLGGDSPIGRIDYRPGRGLRLSDTGVTIGGFASAEAQRLEGDDTQRRPRRSQLLPLLRPPSVRGCIVGARDGGVGRCADWARGCPYHLAFGVERAYGDFGASDAATLRFGKFLTPVGRWNTILADPLTWTTSTPLIVDDVFDESTTGAMLSGSACSLRRGALLFVVRGVSQSARPGSWCAARQAHRRGVLRLGESQRLVRRSVLLRLSVPERCWHQLGGVDGLWRPNARSLGVVRAGLGSSA